MGFEDEFLTRYRNVVASKYPSMVGMWPIINGHNMTTFMSDDWYFCVLHHTGNSAIISYGEGDKECNIFGVSSITEDNLTQIKKAILNIYSKSNKDIVLASKVVKKIGNSLSVDFSERMFSREITHAIKTHERVLGVAKMKVFLSHKGKDKTLVRDFNNTLKVLGFDTWLDEEALVAGANPNRDFEKGVKQSCAVVFFITENFVDEKFLSEEIDFAINEKRERGDEFAIITLKFGTANIPPSLMRYIYKEPQTHLEALREIIRALPIQVCEICYRP